MTYYVIRNNRQFGPYDENALLSYVNSGQILLCDIASDCQTGEQTTVRTVLKRANLKYRIKQAGDLVSQIRNIGSQLILPKQTLMNKSWMKDDRLLMLALVGLTPSVLMFFPIGGFFVFYLVALYFSTIWGLFFYYLFKTPQVSIKTTMLVFFLTQVFVFVLWDVVGLVKLNPFYLLLNASFPLNAAGYILGVGFTEEFVKAIPLLIIARKAKQPLTTNHGLLRIDVWYRVWRL